MGICPWGGKNREYYYNRINLTKTYQRGDMGSSVV